MLQHVLACTPRMVRECKSLVSQISTLDQLYYSVADNCTTAVALHDNRCVVYK